MGFDYDPKDGEGKGFETWDAGEYDASIEFVEEKKSSNGNPMLEVVLEVYDGAKKQKVWDYITAPGGVWKLRQIAEAIGEKKAFDDCKFDLTEHKGSNLTVTLGVKSDKKYGDKNVVKEYAQSRTGAVATSEDDIEIPF